ncbi:hypothetical protein JXB01_03020 [Candidatus Micrarchaeota archaeon]|nr:hypothetical protein [Candidatus Micrarchaeota archaeon]
MKKGFVSFAVVFVCLIVILASSRAVFTGNPDFSSAIAVERSFQNELIIKNSIKESAKNGAITGFSEYLLFSAEPNPEDAVSYATEGAVDNICSLQEIEISDADFIIWCGEPSQISLESAKIKIQKQKRPVLCEGCNFITSGICGEYIDVDILLDDSGNLSPVSISFRKKNDLSGSGVIGISYYSEKFGYSSVSYIPSGEVVYFE